MKRNRTPSSRPRSSSPQRKQPQTLGRRQGGRAYRGRHSGTRSPSYMSRSQSLSPVRADTQRLARLSLDSAADWDTASTSQPVSTHSTVLFQNSKIFKSWPSFPATRWQRRAKLGTGVISTALGLLTFI